jgi:hypothetical protein
MAKRKAASTKVSVKKTTTVRRPAPAEVDVVVDESKGGMGWAEGVAILTTLLLIAAILVTDYELGHHYGLGVFFKP